MSYLNLMPVFARDELQLGSSGLGILLAATGLGTVGGALSVARSPRLRTMPGAQIFTAIAFAIGMIAFTLTSLVPLAALLLFVAGWMSAGFLAINQTAIQMSVEDDVRGRVLSISLLTWGLMPIGQLAVGALASQIGTGAAMVASCLVAIMLVAIVAQRFASLRT